MFTQTFKIIKIKLKNGRERERERERVLERKTYRVI